MTWIKRTREKLKDPRIWAWADLESCRKMAKGEHSDPAFAALGTTLASCDFFARISEDALDRLSAMALRRKHSKGETIFRQGDPCPGLFVLESGSVRVFKLAPSGKEHVLHMVEPGQTFAEVAVIGGFACPAFAQATEDSATVLLPAAPFVRALQSDHQLCLQLMASMAWWVRQLVGLMEDIVLRDATGRLARHILHAGKEESGEFIWAPLKKDLASHLNLTSETLSRSLRRLTDAGLIEQSDVRRLRILDRAALRDLSDGMYPKL